MKFIGTEYGYAKTTYTIQAENGECFTREELEERFHGTFGCRVNWCTGTQASVTTYTD
jgi:hypothetical protein